MTISKKIIVTELKTLNPTNIFRIAKKCGVDISNKKNVYDFILKYANTKKVEKNAYNLSFGCANFKNSRICYKRINLPISETIKYAKYQIANKVPSNYFKPLVEGNNNIYWGNHNDYNKSIAMPNTERNRKVMHNINLLFIKYLQSH